MVEYEAFTYLSSLAAADPVKTVFVLAPEASVTSAADVEAFACASGWVDVVEGDGAVLIAPVMENSWDGCPDDLLMNIYRERRCDFRVASGRGIPGSGDTAWMWETLLFVAGYAEGANVAGSCMLAHPGFAAATVMVDGVPRDLSALEAPSDHWLVPDAVGYNLRNRNVPVAAWFMGAAAAETELMDALADIDGAEAHEERDCQGFATRVLRNPAHPAWSILATPGLMGFDPIIARVAMEELFCRTIRWKNGPDGTLSSHIARADYEREGGYRHARLAGTAGVYHYAVYLPRDMEPADASGLPLVISLHGRGEPTWLFCQKNGWEDLADETRSFGVLLPDSPGNIWNIERDEDALAQMVDEVCGAYGFDASRVYLTGFSNGAVMTAQMATTRPDLFTAISPWNSPGAAALAGGLLGDYEICPTFSDSSYEMPAWIAYGDRDEKAPVAGDALLGAFVPSCGCEAAGVELDACDAYPVRAGFMNPERMRTTVFGNGRGERRVAFTLVENMPHGAYADEARAAWLFMKGFRRVGGAKTVEVIV